MRRMTQSRLAWIYKANEHRLHGGLPAFVEVTAQGDTTLLSEQPTRVYSNERILALEQQAEARRDIRAATEFRALRLHIFLGLTYREVAREVGVSLEYARLCIRRAKRAYK